MAGLTYDRSDIVGALKTARRLRDQLKADRLARKTFHCHPDSLESYWAMVIPVDPEISFVASGWLKPGYVYWAAPLENSAANFPDYSTMGLTP